MKIRTLILAAAIVGGMPSVALPQAPTSLASVRVAYTTRKNTVKPQGELKAQLDALESQIADAVRFGQTGEVRRLYAKGMVLLANRPWTDAADFNASLVLRTDHVIADSAKTYPVRLAQIYAPAIELRAPLSAHAVLRKRPVARPGGQPEPGEAVKDLGTFDGIPRDLRESPFGLELDARDVPDGAYQLLVEISEPERPLGAASLLIALHKGLDDTIARLEKDAARAPADLRAELLFPIDRLRNVNRGRLEARTFDLERDLAASESVDAALSHGKDPFAGRTGDLKRHYVLETAGEVVPYRLYVPTSYTGVRPFPLIVALHGLGGTEDAFFDAYEKKLPPLAEQHGYIVAAPLGYRVDGSYGWGLGTPPADPATRRTQELSEQDVMQVLRRVRQLYKVDENRIYLMGHSMGAIGTWKLAPKYPDVWAAIAPISGAGAADTLVRIRHVPEIVVHGDADPTVNVASSRTMVTKLKDLGAEFKYIEVPGGLHSDVVAPNLAAIIEFFDNHKKSAKTMSQQQR